MNERRTVRVEGVYGDLHVEREAHLPDARPPGGAVDGVEAHALLRGGAERGKRISNEGRHGMPDWHQHLRAQRGAVGESPLRRPNTRAQ